VVGVLFDAGTVEVLVEEEIVGLGDDMAGRRIEVPVCEQ